MLTFQISLDKNMEQEVEQDTKGMKITAVTETEADDYANLASASAFEPAPTSEADLLVKEEPQSETSKFAARLEVFIAAKDATLRKFGDYKVEAKQALNKAQKSKDKNAKYASAVIQDLEKHCPKLEKCVKLLERVCTEDVEDPTEYPKLLEMAQNLKEKHKEIMSSAAKFSFCLAPAAPKRRKRAKESEDVN